MDRSPSMLSSKAVLLGGLAAGMLFSATATAPAAVVYREIFPNDTGANTAAGEAGGWYLNQGDLGAAATANYLLSGGDSAVTDEQWVNSGGVGEATANELAFGFLFRGGNNSGKHLYWTDEYSINLDTMTLESISWYQKNGNAGGSAASDAIRVVLRVGDDWYVSVDAFTNPADTWAQNILTLDENTQWYALAFTPDTTLAMDSNSVVSLPATGTLSAFGLYTDSKTGGSGRFHRFDNYTINAVPEPATIGLAAAGALLLLSPRRWQPV